VCSAETVTVEELRGAGFADGNHFITCACGSVFTGDKRALRCRTCAETEALRLRPILAHRERVLHTYPDWMPEDQRPQRRVVCAACRSDKGRLIVGPRHFDPIMKAQIDTMNYAGDDVGLFEEQGFIDQWGQFLTREDAWIVAKAAHQIIRHVERPGTLYSENLY
tara:strand:- start:413 stop:907 length:495 start_codon:yes stop_codon:yes gene_type:complete